MDEEIMEQCMKSYNALYASIQKSEQERCLKIIRSTFKKRLDLVENDSGIKKDLRELLKLIEKQLKG